MGVPACLVGQRGHGVASHGRGSAGEDGPPPLGRGGGCGEAKQEAAGSMASDG